MEYIIGILILASFFGLAVYAARGGNLMMGMLIVAILWTILPMTGNLLASNPEFIAANGDSIRITWIQAFSKVFQNLFGLGLSAGKCSVWGMVRPGAVRDRHRSHPYPQDHGAGYFPPCSGPVQW